MPKRTQKKYTKKNKKTPNKKRPIKHKKTPKQHKRRKTYKQRGGKYPTVKDRTQIISDIITSAQIKEKQKEFLLQAIKEQDEATLEGIMKRLLDLNFMRSDVSFDELLNAINSSGGP